MLISPGLRSLSASEKIDLGLILKAGETYTEDLHCLTPKDQGLIAGIIAQGTECCKRKKWYNDPIMWFTLGMISGGTMVYIVK